MQSTTYISTKSITPFKGNVISKGEHFKVEDVKGEMIYLVNDFGTRYKVIKEVFRNSFEVKQ